MDNYLALQRAAIYCTPPKKHRAKVGTEYIQTYPPKQLPSRLLVAVEPHFYQQRRERKIRRTLFVVCLLVYETSPNVRACGILLYKDRIALMDP